MGFTRKFGGKTYHFDAAFGTSSSKREATARVKDRRRRGYNARVVKTKVGYQVYYR